MSRRNLFAKELLELESGRWLGDPLVPLLRQIIAKLDDLDIAVNGMSQVAGIWDRIADIEYDIEKLKKENGSVKADGK